MGGRAEAVRVEVPVVEKGAAETAEVLEEETVAAKEAFVRHRSVLRTAGWQCTALGKLHMTENFWLPLA